MSTYEYLHIWVQGCKIKKSQVSLMETKLVASDYPWTDINAQLKKLGQEGWELVTMEALQVPEMAVVSGWYCTFKREQSTNLEKKLLPT